MPEFREDPLRNAYDAAMRLYHARLPMQRHFDDQPPPCFHGLLDQITDVPANTHTSSLVP